jgi:hypothetical protein
VQLPAHVQQVAADRRLGLDLGSRRVPRPSPRRSAAWRSRRPRDRAARGPRCWRPPGRTPPRRRASAEACSIAKCPLWPPTTRCGAALTRYPAWPGRQTHRTQWTIVLVIR